MGRRSNFNQLKSLVGQVRELIPQWRSFVENPRLLGSVVEEHSPTAGRHLLNVASSFLDPYLAGMGLKIETLTEHEVSVRLPYRWKNRAEGGVVHVGALTTLAEFTSRLYWSRHLDLRMSGMRPVEIRGRFFKMVSEDVRARLVLTEAEREALLFRLRAEGQIQIDSTILIYDTRNQLVAQVTVEWSFTKAKALPSGSLREEQSNK